MCVAIVKPAGQWVPEEAMATSFEKNHDGAGYAFYDAKKRQVIVSKGYFTFEAFKKAYMADVTIDMPAMLHFRFSTAGKKDTNNCHPFLLDNAAMMHNGPCLNRMHCNGDKDRSDTLQFAEDMMQHLSIENIKALKPMIEDFAGSEKVAFLFTNGEFMIANEKNGLWDNGCWYSNTGFRKYVAPVYDHTTYTDGRGRYAAWARGSLGGNSTDIVRPLGKSKELFRCSWSYTLRAYCPKDVEVEGVHMQWVERFCGYMPADIKRETSWDKSFIYAATPEASARKGGPSLKVAADWVVVGVCAKNEAELHAYLATAIPWFSPEEKAAKAAKAAIAVEAIEEIVKEKALTVEQSPAVQALTVVH